MPRIESKKTSARNRKDSDLDFHTPKSSPIELITVEEVDDANDSIEIIEPIAINNHYDFITEENERNLSPDIPLSSSWIDHQITIEDGDDDDEDDDNNDDDENRKIKALKLLIDVRKPEITENDKKSNKDGENLPNYKQLLNEFKHAIKNSELEESTQESFSLDEDESIVENNINFEEKSNPNSGKMSPNLFFDENEPIVVTNNITPKRSRNFSSRLLGKSQNNDHPIQSTPLSKHNGQKRIEASTFDSFIFNDNTDLDFNELLQSKIINNSKTSTTVIKRPKFCQYGQNQIKAIVSLPKKSLRPNGLLTYEQIILNLKNLDHICK